MPRLMKLHLDYDPPSTTKIFMIIYLCTLSPLAGVCHYNLIYIFIDYIESEVLPEEETWESETGVIQSAQEEFIWERGSRIIGSGIPSPTAGWPSEVSRRTPFSSSSLRRGRRRAWGPKATPRARTTFPSPPELRIHILSVLHTASFSLT